MTVYSKKSKHEFKLIAKQNEVKKNFTFNNKWLELFEFAVLHETKFLEIFSAHPDADINLITNNNCNTISIPLQSLQLIQLCRDVTKFYPENNTLIFWTWNWRTDSVFQRNYIFRRWRWWNFISIYRFISSTYCLKFQFHYKRLSMEYRNTSSSWNEYSKIPIYFYSLFWKQCQCPPNFDSSTVFPLLIAFRQFPKNNTLSRKVLDLS